MFHQIKQVFHSPKFVVGFVIFVIMLVFAIFYPMVSSFGPMEMVGTGFYAPGTYVSVVDTAQSGDSLIFNVDTASSAYDSALPQETRESMKKWLVNQAGVAEGDIDLNDAEALVALWQEKYDPELSQGLITADKRAYQRLDEQLKTLGSGDGGIILAVEDEEGNLQVSKEVAANQFVNVSDISNTVTVPMGTDNFGADMATKLASSIGVSLQIGLLAGIIATIIGLFFGLLSGYLGGWVDDFLVFITNLFTVIPSFVILILIANSVGQAARGPMMVAMIIGCTSWPWTARSVRSQVLSLRNRDHVNLSKLSGHSMPRIIVQDILPYVASYVVMAMILQISSGILSEAQLSMLGLGPSTATTTTLGIMMNWAQQFAAIQSDSWWAFIPVVISITLITFSLNLMNTGLDQVFNPQLRDELRRGERDYG